MCFAPQRRALFRHLNFQKCSEPVRILHFWLRSVLRATTGRTFSTSQLTKVVRTWCFVIFLHIWTSKCASRHKVCFVRFYFETCFAPQRRAICHPSPDYMPLHLPLLRGYFSTLRSHKSLEKHSVSWLSYLFAHLDHLSSETFSFWSSFFFSSPLWLFPSLLFICPYCRKFDF